MFISQELVLSYAIVPIQTALSSMKEQNDKLLVSRIAEYAGRGLEGKGSRIGVR
jgi:hypothetical protein